MPFSQSDYDKLPEELKTKLVKVGDVYFDSDHVKDRDTLKQKDETLSAFDGLNPAHRDLFAAAQSDHNKARLEQAIAAGGIEAYMSAYAAEQIAPLKKQLEASKLEHAQAQQKLQAEQFQRASYAAMSKAGIRAEHHEAYHALAEKAMQAQEKGGALAFLIGGKSVDEHFSQLAQSQPGLLGTITSGGAKNQTPPTGQPTASDSLAEANRLYLAGQHNESFAMIDRLNHGLNQQPHPGRGSMAGSYQGAQPDDRSAANPVTTGGSQWQ